MSRPRLSGLSIADDPERWAALGFAVADDGMCELDGVRLSLGAGGRGITSWSLSGVAAVGHIDGLPTEVVADREAPRASSAHPNGALALDHVVVLSPSYDHTAAALDAVGLGLRRERDGGGFRQGFRRIGPAILELVESRSAAHGPARFWGLVVIVSDLDALAAQLGDRLRSAHDAVQSGRRIATLSDRAGLSVKLAFMTPEPD
jgi:hypothetical protein